MIRIVIFTVLAIANTICGIFAILNDSLDYRRPYIALCFAYSITLLIIGIVGLAK